MKKDESQVPHGDERSLFKTPMFRYAAGMSDNARDLLWRRLIVRTPGTLGEKGAWRIDGHRLALEWALARIREKGFKPDGSEMTFDETGEAVKADYGLDDPVPKLVAAAAFVIENPRETIEHLLERRGHRWPPGSSPPEVTDIMTWMAEREADILAGETVCVESDSDGRRQGRI